MRIITGRVRQGSIELDGDVPPEGTTVTVIAPDDGDTVELGPDEEAELIEAIAEADRGQTVDASVVREMLRRR